MSVLAFLLIAGNSHATHIIGGEIYYDCLGNNQFRIVLKLYRDCFLGQAPYDNPANVAVYNAQGGLVSNIAIPFPGSSFVPQGSINPCYQDEADLCVEEAVYEKVVTLPPIAGGYTLVYQRCCRNESILNISNPGDTGSTYMIQIPESAFTSCNSSPRFSIFPPIVLCINDPLQFDHSAIDPDGDSLVYSLCDPFEGATPDEPMPIPPGPPPYNFVNFIPPYSSNNPLASNPQAAVDPISGQLTAFPTQLGQYVVAVCVTEYRNGVALSTNKRDFQFNVVACDGYSLAEFLAPTADVENVGNLCNGLMVNFINESENGLFYRWDFGVPGTDQDVSTYANPVFLYPDTGNYTVSLIVNPGYSCSDTATLQIAVYRELIAQVSEQDGQCIIGNSFDFLAEGEFESNASFQWEFTGPASMANSTLQNALNVSYSEAGIFPVYLAISTVHCEAHDTIDITVYPELNVDFVVNDQDACEPAAITFQNLSSYSPGALFYWSFGDGTTSTLANPVHVYDTPGSYDLSLEIRNLVGCTDTFSLSFEDYILIRPRPSAGISVTPAKTSILYPDVVFYNESTEESGSWLDPGTGVQLFGPVVPYTYQDTGWYDAHVIAVNEQGCYDTAYVDVRIDPLFTIYFPNAFSPNDDGTNDFFAPKGEGFKSYEFVIFDRWGVEVFRTFNPTQTWDGRANSGRNISPSGVYNYKVWVKDVFNTEHIYTGMVVLVR